MTTGKELVRAQARRKGWVALGSGLATGLGFALTLGAPLLPWIILAGGGLWTARKTYEWFRFRGEWGIRF